MSDLVRGICRLILASILNDLEAVKDLGWADLHFHRQ